MALLLTTYYLSLVQPPTPADAAIHLKHQRCAKNITNLSYKTGDSTLVTSRELLLVHQNCLSLELPYATSTLPDYVPGFNFTSIDEVQSYLQRWKPIEKLPGCWPYMQRALCSILMPQYDEDLSPGKVSRIYLPSVEICSDLRKNCKFVEKYYNWPAIFNCNDTSLYYKNCTNDLRHLKTSQTSCLYPLVSSNQSASWLEDVHGCSLSCKYPISNPRDQANISSFIKLISTCGLLCTFGAIILFGVSEANTKSSRIARVVKRCNMGQFAFYLGWSLQVFYTNDIACGPDGAALYGLPLVANACVLTFFLTYLPSLNNLFWCAYLSKLCCEKLTGERKPSKDVKLSRTLDLVSYGVPVSLFTLVALLGEIDGRGLYGICTVGQRSTIIKALFVFVPKIIGNLYGGFYLFITVINLTRVERKSPSLWRNFARIFVMAILNLTDIMFSVGAYVYEYYGNVIWKESIVSYVKCSLDPETNFDTTIHECSIREEPLVAIYYLEILSNLAIGIVIASWACCKTNFISLRRKIIYLLESEKERELRIFSRLTKSAGPNGQVFDQTSLDHDMIDMTSPNKTEPNVELDNKRCDRATPSDIASCNLSQEITNSSRSEQVRPYRSDKSKKYVKKARDIINDQRMRQQLLDPAQAIDMGSLGLNPEQLDMFKPPLFPLPSVGLDDILQMLPTDVQLQLGQLYLEKLQVGNPKFDMNQLVAATSYIQMQNGLANGEPSSAKPTDNGSQAQNGAVVVPVASEPSSSKTET